MKYSIIEALKEATNDVELAFRIANLVKFQRFTELDEIIDDIDINLLKGYFKMLKLYRAYEYYDLWRDLDGGYIPNGQYMIDDVLIDDGMAISDLKRFIKKLFNLKRNIRLSSLNVDWDFDMIVVEYCTKRECIPIGHLDLIIDNEEVKEVINND